MKVSGLLDRALNGLSAVREAVMPTDSALDQDVALEDDKKGGTPEVPTQTRSMITVGLAVIILVFGFGGTWAAVWPMSGAIVAPGQIKVFSNRKKVQHLEGGIVTEILVANGDWVSEGQVLARLDKTRAIADQNRVQTQYDEARATVARLMAERDDAERIDFPGDMAARQDNESVRETVSGQMKLFQARRQSLEGQLSMVSERIKQLGEEVRGLEAQAAAKSEQVTLISQELDGLRELHAKGYAPMTRILALERAAAQLKGERGDHVARIAKAKVLMSEAELEKLQIRKNLQEKVVAELRQRQTEMYDLAESLEKAAFTLNNTDIRAGTDGIVVNKQISAIGEVIKPGDTVLELVPVNDSLIVEAQVRPQDIDNVQQGLNADVQMTAFSQRTSPRLTGEVTYVSADSLIDERTGMPYFTANITVPEDEVARLGEDQTIKPGMPAEVFITTGARTPLQYLTKPIADSVRRAWRED